ncbi:MAG: putative monooxygenase [Oscillospiraceae bacterium]|nr:putative monooxygenase [Oscillospiraceae bacterium]
MIQIVAKHFVKPEHVESYLKLAGKLVAKTRQLDAGCIQYALFQDLKDSSILTIIEQWESQDALDQHMAAAHFKEMVPKLGEFCEKPGEINLYRPVEAEQ